MKIFITGGSGLIGQYLNIELNKEHEILTQYYNNIGNCRQFNSVNIPIDDYSKIEEVFNSFHPDIVIHTASVSNAEKADQLPADLVYSINVNSTQLLAELCAKYNAKLIYFSTDLVYAGYRGSFLNEEAKLIPISLYAETKLMGEIKIKQTFNNYVILRVALQYGFGLNHSSSHFHKMFNELSKGTKVKLFTDQFRSPLSLIESAKILSQLFKKDLCQQIINFGGCERLSRYDLGSILCDEAGFDKSLLIPTTMEEAGALYKVQDVSMNIQKLIDLGINPMSAADSIKQMLKN